MPSLTISIVTVRLAGCSGGSRWKSVCLETLETRVKRRSDFRLEVSDADQSLDEMPDLEADDLKACLTRSVTNEHVEYHKDGSVWARNDL